MQMIPPARSHYHNLLSGSSITQANNIPVQTPGFAISEADRNSSGHQSRLKTHFKTTKKWSYPLKETQIKQVGPHTCVSSVLLRVNKHFLERYSWTTSPQIRTNSMHSLPTWTLFLLLITFRAESSTACVLCFDLHSECCL